MAQVDSLVSGLHDYDQLLEHRFIHTLKWPGTVFYLLDKGAGPAIEPVNLFGPRALSCRRTLPGITTGRLGCQNLLHYFR